MNIEHWHMADGWWYFLVTFRGSVVFHFLGFPPWSKQVMSEVCNGTSVPDQMSHHTLLSCSPIPSSVISHTSHGWSYPTSFHVSRLSWRNLVIPIVQIPQSQNHIFQTKQVRSSCHSIFHLHLHQSTGRSQPCWQNLPSINLPHKDTKIFVHQNPTLPEQEIRTFRRCWIYRYKLFEEVLSDC